MTWTAFLPENVRQNPQNFVGPNVAGAIVQSLETGILINQSVRFWSRAHNEPLVTRLLAAFVSCVALFQTAIAIYNTWRVIVLGFGDVILVVNLGWPDRIQPALNCIMAAPFQAFLIWRCWNVLQRRWIVLAPLISLLLANVLMNILITVDIFFIDSIAEIMNGPPRSYITAFVLTAVLDMMISALMIWFLLRVRSQVISRHLARIIARLHRMVWEAAVPPCVCAIAACIVYITMSQKNLWDVFLQSVLGKLYVISLFVILNGRADLKQSVPSSTQSTRLSRYWAHDAPVHFRVDLTSVVDRQVDSEAEGMTPTTDAPLYHNVDRREWKARLSPHDHGREYLWRASTAPSPAHGAFSFELQNRAESSSYDMVTRPPTVWHRSVRMGDRRMSY